MLTSARARFPRWITLCLGAGALAAAAWIAAPPAGAEDPAPGQPVEVRLAGGPGAEAPQVLAVEGKGWLERRAGNLVLHLNGTPYEMGFQHGKLLRRQIAGLIRRVRMMANAQIVVDPKQNPFPKLREAYERCLPFIPPDYLEEMRGLADGSGLPLDHVRDANMIPELFHCSGFALWGRATKDGVLYHGRVLDYAMEIGYHKYSVLIVQKPAGKHGFINVGYAGFLGSVTGTNDAQVSFGEMGGRGEGNWDGMPMAFLMRKGLEEADTLDRGVAIFRDTKRTCQYYYVVSDAKIPDARGLACEPDKFLVLKPGEAHQELPVPLGILDTILMSGGDRFRLLAGRVAAGYGSFDGRAGLALMRRPVAMKSAIHTALFAPKLNKLWVSNAVGLTPSSELPYTEYDTQELLGAPLPPAPPAGASGAPSGPLPPPAAEKGEGAGVDGAADEAAADDESADAAPSEAMSASPGR
ncbi:MAG: peptidase C45 [Planctomycetes bacterium]|nr:peptidase C45 [Planctomycetota bacterium]